MSIRLRFALACAGVVLVLGSLVLAGVYLVVQQSLAYRTGLITPRYIAVDNYRGYRFDRIYEVARKRVMQVRAIYGRDTLANVRTVGALLVPAATG